MSRENTLKLLAAVVDRLEPIGEVSRGAPLRSSDWNAVVSALSDVARLVAERERSTDEQLVSTYARADHAHAGQASLGWFEPQSRRLLETATQGAVELRLRQDKSDARIDSLRSEVADLRADMAELKVAIDGLQESDFARERSLGRMGNEVESLRALGGGLDTLTDRLNGLGDDIETVIGVRDQLSTPDGESIDLADTVRRVGELEALRENLRTASGEIVRIRTLEASIARLEEDAFTRTAAEGLIADQLRDAGFLEDAQLLDDIAGRVSTRLDGRFATLEQDTQGLRGGVDALGVALEPVAGRLATLEGGLAGTSERVQALTAATDALSGLPGRVAALDSTLTSRLGDLDALRSETDRIGGVVQGLQGLQPRVQATETALAGVGQRASTLEVQVSELSALPGRVSALETLTLGDGALSRRLTVVESGVQEVQVRVTANEAELDTLAPFPEQVRALAVTTDALARDQAQTAGRVTQLIAESQTSTGLDKRVSTLEERVAQQSADLRAVSQEVAPLQELRPRVLDMSQRLEKLESSRTTRLTAAGTPTRLTPSRG